MAGTAAGELDSQQLDADAFAKRLFDLGATQVLVPLTCMINVYAPASVAATTNSNGYLPLTRYHTHAGALASTRARNREVLYSVSKGLLMARRKRQKVLHLPESAATQASQPSVPITAHRNVHDQDAGSPTAEAAAQISRVTGQAADIAAIADDGSPLQPAEANGKASGSKAKRKRMKKLQQQLADASGDGPVERAEAGSAAANGTSPDASGARGVAGVSEQAEPPVSMQDADDGVQQAHAESTDSKGPANGHSSEAGITPNGQLSMQQTGGASAQDTPRGQTSPRASSKRKSVRFHLRDNLFFEPGGQVPPPAVRTPPKAQPKVSRYYWRCVLVA